MIMAKKVKVTPEQFTERWSRGLTNSADKIRSGVESVTESPTEAAAAQADVWLQNVTQSRDKYVKGLKAVSLNQWKTATLQKGIPALQNSVNVAKPKVQNAAGKLIPAINDLLGSMPARGTTLDQNLERVRHMAQGLREKFK